ncbi:hypothetical protein ACFL3V_00130 [Nanoarchaeota archaeon]
MTETSYVRRYQWGLVAGQAFKAVILIGALLLVWWLVFLLTGTYHKELHMIATFSSALMITTGNSHGIIERIIR